MHSAGAGVVRSGYTRIRERASMGSGRSTALSHPKSTGNGLSSGWRVMCALSVAVCGIGPGHIQHLASCMRFEPVLPTMNSCWTEAYVEYLDSICQSRT